MKWGFPKIRVIIKGYEYKGPMAVDSINWKYKMVYLERFLVTKTDAPVGISDRFSFNDISEFIFEKDLI